MCGTKWIVEIVVIIFYTDFWKRDWHVNDSVWCPFDSFFQIWPLYYCEYHLEVLPLSTLKQETKHDGKSPEFFFEKFTGP